MGREFSLLVIQIDLCNRCLLKFYEQIIELSDIESIESGSDSFVRSAKTRRNESRFLF